MDKILRKGDKVRLWPKDTHAKYGVVRDINAYSVTFEITKVDSGENHYKVGDIITLPLSHVFIADNYE